MNGITVLSHATATVAAALMASTTYATAVDNGSSGKTYADSTISCKADPVNGVQSPAVDVGLIAPQRGTKATVSLNKIIVGALTAKTPSTTVWLTEGENAVLIRLSKTVADSYTYTVTADQCSLPDTSGNTFSADGTLEYSASLKSYATVTPGCALNPATGRTQPYINLFDNGNYLLNVTVNNVPLTQLSATHPHTPVFLSAGTNVISAANGYVSVDYFIRDGGTGECQLP